MEIYAFSHVNFTYPQGEKQVLDDLHFSINRGEFIILCGPSGCGKSTLLRHLKTCLTPHGLFEGTITFEGTPLHQVTAQDQSQKIGYVLQSPENQMVTDKVWHELAFGLESLGYDTPTIRRRVAEIAAFFGIENWFYKDVAELSGGQKQLLSLAAVMAMQPSVLVLDEPTAQLDPIAASDFLAQLGKINRELGTTVILTEHRLEEAFPYASRILVMEEGRILCDDTPQAVGLHLKEAGSAMFHAMPTSMRVWAAVETRLPCPLTVRDGTDFLTARAQEQPLCPLPEKQYPPRTGEVVLESEDLWFRYEKNSPDVIKGLRLNLCKGEFYALLGGNGTGKTTALKVLSGLVRPYRGKVTLRGKLAHLPQNPQTLFVRRTVREDLYEVFQDQKIAQREQDARVARVVHLCRLHPFLDRHPFDISGGEQQRTALAKILLTQPDILLLDEPTKGFDAEFKEIFAVILRKLMAQGVSILMVSHDVSFCAENAHSCGLYFDGNVVAQGNPREFFSGNSFYTTPANRMARHLEKNAVTVADVISLCGGQVPEEREVEAQDQPLPPVKAVSAAYQPEPLPLWRKLLGLISGLVALAVFLYTTAMMDLTQLLKPGGITELAKGQLLLYGLLILSLFVCLLAITRRETGASAQLPRRKLRKRTMLASLLLLILVPVTLFAGVFYLDNQYYSLIAIAVLLECMLPFFLVFEGRKPQARALVIIAVLCGIGVAGRGALFMLPQFKPVMALTIIAGVALGGETGFLVGAVTMLVSNMLFSQGPWTPWQMFCMGIIGFLAGVCYRKGILRRTRTSLCVFGAVAAVGIYGGLMNPASAIMWNPSTISWNVILAYYITGLPMDLVQAAATVVFLWLAGKPMLEKLDRVKVKYGLLE